MLPWNGVRGAVEETIAPRNKNVLKWGEGKGTQVLFTWRLRPLLTKNTLIINIFFNRN